MWPALFVNSRSIGAGERRKAARARPSRAQQDRVPADVPQSPKCPQDSRKTSGTVRVPANTPKETVAQLADWIRSAMGPSKSLEVSCAGLTRMEHVERFWRRSARASYEYAQSFAKPIEARVA